MPNPLVDVTIAIVATSHAQMGDTGEPTGVWLEELTTPYYALVDAGAVVDVYSVKGGPIPVDPRSLSDDERADSVLRYREDDAFQASVQNTSAVGSVDIAKYDAVFLPGGHGTMWDYPGEAIATLVSDTVAAGKPIAMVCHGPAALSGAVHDGKPLVAGRRVAGFTNSEEKAVGLTDAVPFLLEDRLKELGGDYVSGPDFEPFAVRDGLLITGQNPQSAGKTADLLIEALSE